MTKLALLSLNHNYLESIDIQVFKRIDKSLKEIKLNDNDLKEIRNYSIKKNMKISLSGNPILNDSELLSELSSCFHVHFDHIQSIRQKRKAIGMRFSFLMFFLIV